MNTTHALKVHGLRPARKALWLVFVFAILLFIGELGAVLDAWAYDDIRLVTRGLVVILLVLMIADVLLSWQSAPLEVRRTLTKNLALEVWSDVDIHVQHSFVKPMMLTAFDWLPSSCQTEGLPLRIQLQPGQSSQVTYRLRPLVRGELKLPKIAFAMPSVLGFWCFHRHYIKVDEARVFPNFKALEGFQLLAVDNHSSQMGIKKKPRRGEGMEFHQLRDYRAGDAIRQIDWKATARRQKLISREYQDERDQQVILMLDSGRKMLTRDGATSHFDHCLNCLLMLSFIALKQGDAVQMMSFGSESRWTMPVKGAVNISSILHQFYDLYPKKVAVDYLAAAQELLQRQPKRSLIIITTNLRDDDLDDLLVAVRLLQRKHLVLIANLYEQAILDVLDHPVESLETALRYAGTTEYLRRQTQAADRLRAEGANVLDSAPDNLTVAVINRYLEIKRAGLL